MTAPRTVDIELDGVGSGRIVVDGTELAAGVSAVEVDAEAGDRPTGTLRLKVTKRARFEGLADVTVDADTAAELQARARDYIDAQNKAALERARELGAEDSLIGFPGLSPQMVEALAKDGVKTLEDFATCADWELAGGWTTEGGERVKDDGVLEPFEVSLEEAQELVMTARVALGWVDPDELAADEAAAAANDEEEA